MTIRKLVGVSIAALFTLTGIAEAQNFQQRRFEQVQTRTVQPASFVKAQHERFQCESGSAPDKLSLANQACTAEFGKGWRVAEHHDIISGSSGWMFSAYGNVGTLGKRFWTDIRNQPNGVCWDRNQ